MTLNRNAKNAKRSRKNCAHKTKLSWRQPEAALPSLTYPASTSPAWCRPPPTTTETRAELPTRNLRLSASPDLRLSAANIWPRLCRTCRGRTRTSFPRFQASFRSWETGARSTRLTLQPRNTFPGVEEVAEPLRPLLNQLRRLNFHPNKTGASRSNLSR